MNARPLLLALGFAGLVAHATLADAPSIPNRFAAYNLGINQRPAAEQVKLLQSFGYQGMMFWWQPARKVAQLDELQSVSEIRDGSFPLLAALTSIKIDGSVDVAGYRELLPRLAQTKTALWFMINGKGGTVEQHDAILKQVCNLANEFGVQVVFYPHHGHFIEDVDSSVTMVKRLNLPNLTTSIHLCHELKAGTLSRIDEIAAKSAPYLGLASINGGFIDADKANDDWSRAITPLDTGDVDTGAFVNALVRHGYKGPILLHTFGLKEVPEQHYARSMNVWKTLAAKAAIFMLQADAAPASQPTSKPAVAEDEPEQVRLSVGREDEYDNLIADVKLEGEALAKFQAINKERIEKLKAFVESEDGKQLIALREELAAARRDRQAAKVAPLRAQITPLSDKYWTIRNQGRKDLLATLSEDQLKRAAGLSLFARCTNGLERLELPAEQLAKIRTITNEAAAEWFKPEFVQSDPYFRELLRIEAPTKKRIVEEVLTAEQREKLKTAAR